MRTSISFIVLFYNDAPTVGSVLQSLDDQLTSFECDYEIIVIDDCSTDDTWSEIDRMASELSHVVRLRNKDNLGVGGSFYRAVHEAQYTLIGYTDGDDQYEPSDLHRYLSQMEDCDVVTGCRRPRADGWKRVWASVHFNYLINAYFATGLRDINSALKLYRADLLKQLPPWDAGAFYDAEIMIRLAQDHQARIVELPIKHKLRRYGEATGLSQRNVFSILENLLGSRMACYRRSGAWVVALSLHVSLLRRIAKIVL
ncbi:MAG: hypothetical protein CMI16_12310 [Opitutaceae bacterium]|jgi:glycosyltransferase involved in cell wall biosynthesis|nr:hypothetical protein [Opitutaceae bacterium]